MSGTDAEPGSSGRGATSRRPEGGAEPPRFEHVPVMVDEVVALFAPVPPGVVIDATVGGGGHAAALLRAHPQLSVVGLDRDIEAVVAARAALAPFGGRATVLRARFDQLAEVLRTAEVAGSEAVAPLEAMARPGTAARVEAAARLDQVPRAEAVAREPGAAPALSGVLFDLGVSSVQLDHADRGFSYRLDAPLDMRMDQDDDVTAAAVVNTASVGELARIFADSGERRLARRIAEAVVAARPLATTAQLADVVARAVPAAARRRGHPARRVFQALRIAVNDELTVLGATLPVALDLLRPGGRCVVISYHSGEDRLVKAVFGEAATGGCRCPVGLPCVCGAVPSVRLLNRGARKPSIRELEVNRRADSARLRACERLGGNEAGLGGSEAG